MNRSRIPFLPAFLTLLGVAFAVVLVARIRSYGGAVREGSEVAAANGEASSSVAQRSSSSSPDDGGAASGGDVQTSTIVPAGSTGTAGMTARERRDREPLNAPAPNGVAAGTASPQAPPVHTIAAS